MLRSLAAELRVQATQNANVPELWLSVRDFEGLAGRLMSEQPSEWRQGFAAIWITGQDLGVLDELLEGHGRLPIRVSEDRVAALARLRHFLGHYCAREFDLDPRPNG